MLININVTIFLYLLIYKNQYLHNFKNSSEN